MRLRKWEGNPILRGTGAGDWEAAAVLNPGAWQENGQVYLLYRACAEYEEYRIYLGLATSTDGFHFTRVSDQPVMSPGEVGGFDGGCVEDPRIVKYDGTFYITYACRPYPPHGFPQMTITFPPGTPRLYRENLSTTALATSKDLRSFQKLGRITREELDDRDGVLFPEKIGGRYVMFHRPKEWAGEKYGTPVPSMWLAYSDDLLHWGEEVLLAKPEFDWERGKLGAGPPPIKTEAGWLVIYHGVDEKGIYRNGLMMLDGDDPRKILARAPDFVLEPEAKFERVGFYPGVVFPCGNVVLGDEVFVYYGGADVVCCAATAPLKQLVDYVMQFGTS